MKNLLISFGLALSIVPMAFWEMNGPFLQPVNSHISSGDVCLDKPIKISFEDLYKNAFNSFIFKYKNNSYTYLYNIETGYSIVCLHPLMSWEYYIPNSNIRFLLGELGENNDILRYNFFNFYFFKEKLNIEQIDQKERTTLTEGANLYCLFNNIKQNISNIEDILCKIDPKLDKDHINSCINISDVFSLINSVRKNQCLPEIPNHTIRIKDRFTTLSGIEVINQKDKVEIKKGEKIVDFQKALKKYFNYDKNKDIIIDAVNQSIPKDRTEKGQNLNSFEIGQAAFAMYTNVFPLLASSQILAVYAVINDEGKDSIIWGLAQDKKTEERFHWITKIKEGISILFD